MATKQLLVVLITLAGAATAAYTQADTAATRPTARGAGAATAAERALYRIEDEWAQALVRRDVAAFRRIIDRRWVYTDERGLLNKEQFIADVTGGGDTVTAAGNEEMRARVFGTVAVVTGILYTKGRGKDGPFDRRYRYTDTWLRRGGRWVCIASQDMLMPQS
jgi:ketosteroid isomerase-like protein